MPVVGAWPSWVVPGVLIMSSLNSCLVVKLKTIPSAVVTAFMVRQCTHAVLTS